MAQYISKAAVVAEINNWIQGVKHRYTMSRVQFSLSDRIESLENLLSFIDTLKVKEVQEESASKDLEEAAFDYAEACKYDGGEKLLCVEHFKAGAQWQKQQNSLEMKEVNLEKELETLDSLLYDLDGVAVQGATHYLTVEDVKDIAKHFYELGLKAQKL